MKIRKIIKFVLIALIGFMIGKIGVRELHDSKRPFQFEKYKTRTMFINEVRKRFPNGGDVHDAIKVLQKSGAKCSLDRSYDAGYGYIHKGAVYIATCSYQADFVSLNPLVTYSVVIQTDGNYKIIHLYAMRIDDAFVI